PSGKPGKSSTLSRLTIRPPGICASTTSVLRPRRAPKSPAVSPASPPPTTTRSWLSPLINRNGLVLPRPKDAPVAVRLAADHDRFDLILREHRDGLVVGRLQLRRVRLRAEGGARVDVVLD